jgi:hypothetical protein
MNRRCAPSPLLGLCVVTLLACGPAAARLIATLRPNKSDAITIVPTGAPAADAEPIIGQIAVVQV